MELHQHAKFRRNRLNCGRDMVIFRFFNMAAAAILDFQNLKFLTFGNVKRVKLRNHAKFCRSRSTCGRDIAFFEFLRWRTPPCWIFNGRKGQEGRSASVCQISSKSVEPRPRYVNFNISLAWKCLFTPLLRVIYHPKAGTWYSLPLYKIWSL